MAHRSRKHIEACERNHKIFRLRGLYASSRVLVSDPNNETLIRQAINSELELLGADSIEEHRRKEREELYKKSGEQE